MGMPSSNVAMKELTDMELLQVGHASSQAIRKRAAELRQQLEVCRGCALKRWAQVYSTTLDARYPKGLPDAV